MGQESLVQEEFDDARANEGGRREYACVDEPEPGQRLPQEQQSQWAGHRPQETGWAGGAALCPPGVCRGAGGLGGSGRLGCQGGHEASSPDPPRSDTTSSRSEFQMVWRSSTKRGSFPGQLLCEHAGGLHRPPQRRHRVAPYIRLDQRQQCRPQPRIQIRDSFAAAARTPHPPQWLLTGLKFEHALADRRLADRSGLRHGPDTAVSQRPSLRSHQQPSLPLVRCGINTANFTAS
ncbi:hypothetical protein GCM10022206_74260 [Streptomyces chiangmaiensis]